MKIVLSSILFAGVLCPANAEGPGRRDEGSGSPSFSFQHFGNGEGGATRRAEALGKEGKSGDPRIVGGEQSKPGEFPYYVDSGGCGGMLIAPDVVLSAGHCAGFFDRHLIGSYQYQTVAYGAEYRNVVEEVLHPDYDGGTLSNDFLLIKLEEPYTLSSPIALKLNEDPSLPMRGQDLTVLGLGRLSAGGPTPEFLRDVVVKTFSTDECNVKGSYEGSVEDDIMFCAGIKGGGKDSCQGDSGGPIVIRNFKEHILVGVVSWGTGCAWEGYPGIYARVSSATEWIKEVVCDDWDSDAYFCDGSPSSDDEPSEPGFTCDDMYETPLVMDMMTDMYGNETVVFLGNSQLELIWDEWGFGDDEEYQFTACLDGSGCSTLNVFDWYGDGITAPGGVQLTWDGEVVYSGPTEGHGTVFQFGDACPSM